MIQCTYFGLKVTISEGEAVQVILNYLDDCGLERPSYARCLVYFADIHDAVQVAPIIPVFGMLLRI